MPTNNIPYQLPKTFESRKRKVLAGMEELDRWLQNLIRNGLADPQVQQFSFWDDISKRMVDAQAGGIGRRLQRMANIPHNYPNWIELLLEEIGQLYILLQAVQRFELVDIETQYDLRTAIGWNIQKTEFIDVAPIVRDKWMVIGQRKWSENRLQTQRLWLYGEQTQQIAFILESVYGDKHFELQLQPGHWFEGDVVFYPGHYPLRVAVREIYTKEWLYNVALPLKTIEQNLRDYSQALACVPWLAFFPMTIAQVLIFKREEKKWFQDREQALIPISPDYIPYVELLAINTSKPFDVMGEWSNGKLSPVSAYVNERFINLTYFEDI